MINCLQEELIKVSGNVSSQSHQVIYWVIFGQTEVDVTRIILKKSQDFCQLASYKHGSVSDLRFLSTICLAYGFPWLRGGCTELFYLFLPLFIFKSVRFTK